MTTSLVVAITVVAVLLAVLGVASTLARRRIGLVHLAVAGVLEALLLVQAVLAVVADGRRAHARRRPRRSSATWPASCSCRSPACCGPAPSRPAGRARCSAWPARVVGVMVWRLLQLWEATGA